MGTSYSAIPMDARAANWLQSLDLPAPSSFGTPATEIQLRAALAAITDFTVNVRQTPDGWDAEISGSAHDGSHAHSTLWVKTQTDGTCTYHFHKGWPEIALRVTHEIACLAGPQLFVPHETAVPVVVDPTKPFDDTLQAFFASLK